MVVAMLASLTVPPLLAVLGHRINAGRVQLPWGRSGAGRRWERLAHSVMRRPVWYAVGVVAVLVLPPGAEPRVVVETIAEEFPAGSTDPVNVVVSGLPAGQVQAYADRRAGLPEVTGVTVTARAGGTSLITVDYPGAPTGEAAQAAVRAIRDLPAPAGSEVLVGGRRS